jgi:hypothetical protein
MDGRQRMPAERKRQFVHVYKWLVNEHPKNALEFQRRIVIVIRTPAPPFSHSFSEPTPTGARERRSSAPFRVCNGTPEAPVRPQTGVMRLCFSVLRAASTVSLLFPARQRYRRFMRKTALSGRGKLSNSGDLAVAFPAILGRENDASWQRKRMSIAAKVRIRPPTKVK